MPVLILAQSVSDNAPGGAVLTFAFPIILFAIVAAVLYVLLFARPHRRVPAERVALATATPGAPDPAASHASAVAAGLPTASGGGAVESATEPHGAKRDTLAAAENGTGNVPGEAGDSGESTTDGTEASE